MRYIVNPEPHWRYWWCQTHEQLWDRQAECPCNGLPLAECKYGPVNPIDGETP